MSWWWLVWYVLLGWLVLIHWWLLWMTVVVFHLSLTWSIDSCCEWLLLLIPSASTFDFSVLSSFSSVFSAWISSFTSCLIWASSSLYKYCPFVSSVNYTVIQVSMWSLQKTKWSRSWIATYVSSSPNSLLWRLGSFVLCLSKYLVRCCMLSPRSYGNSLCGWDPSFSSNLQSTLSSSTCVPLKLTGLLYGFLVVAGGAIAVKLILVCCVGSFQPHFFFFLLSVPMVAFDLLMFIWCLFWCLL